MTSARDWLQRSDWRRRQPGFGELRLQVAGDTAFAAMEFIPRVAIEPLVPEPLWQLWLGLDVHRNILEAVSRHWLRYAALDFGHEPLAITDAPHNAARVASWGAKLTWVAEFLLRSVPREMLGWMAAPRLLFDLEGEIRLVFVGPDWSAPTRLPPEVVAEWPRCNERGLIFAVGRSLRDAVAAARVAATTPVGAVIARCLEPDPAQRFATMQELRDALRLAGGPRIKPPWLRASRLRWNRVEEGLGLLAVGQHTKALLRFEAALALEPNAAVARELQREALQRGADLEAPRSDGVPRSLSWDEVAPVALRREQARDFAGALALYDHVRHEATDLGALEVAVARCHLHLGSLRDAAAHAASALQRIPDHPEAHQLRVDALSRAGRHADALEAADAWLAASPAEARAHHARGKSLLGLGRPLEARAPFDRACLLNPALIEAMLLRREADRTIKKLRASVGVAAAMTLDIPDHLAELRDPLCAGRLQDGMQLLQRPEHAGDAAAQLLLGSLLSFDARFDDALAAFDRAARLGADHVHAALLGKARTLLELDRAAAALAIFEHVITERPDLGEAHEGRARALKLLGRDADAEAAFRDYLSTTTRGSDLRVRASRNSPGT